MLVLLSELYNPEVFDIRETPLHDHDGSVPERRIEDGLVGTDPVLFCREFGGVPVELRSARLGFIGSINTTHGAHRRGAHACC